MFCVLLLLLLVLGLQHVFLLFVSCFLASSYETIICLLLVFVVLLLLLLLLLILVPGLRKGWARQINHRVI